MAGYRALQSHTRQRVTSRWGRLLPLAFLVTAVASACQFDAITVPVGRERPVVHAVLNPWAPDQIILLERTLTGRVAVIDDRVYNRNDPIVSAGGVPISNARVVVYTAGGDSGIAVEDLSTRADGLGAGVYRIGNLAVPREPGSPPLSSIPVVPGGRYRLRITTPDGDIITGETRLPATQGVAPGERTRFFNRDTDTLRLFWDPVPQAQRYMVRIESPWGPMFLFTDEYEAQLPGSLRNVFQQNLPSVFLPGFRSRVSVAAIDANYFDYFRSANDPFTGTGLIGRLNGAIGVFGSMAELYSYRVVVSADVDMPIEGWYELRRTGAGATPSAIKLYVESEAGPYSFLTGEFYGSNRLQSASLVGLQSGTSVSVAFLRFSTDVSDTLAVFTGSVVGDSLIGSVRFSPSEGGFVEPARYGKAAGP